MDKEKIYITQKEELSEEEIDLAISLFNISNPNFSIIFSLGDNGEIPAEAEGELIYVHKTKAYINPKFYYYSEEERQTTLQEIIEITYKQMNEYGQIRIITPRLTLEDVNLICDALIAKAHWFFQTPVVELNKYRESENEELNEFMLDFYRKFYSSKMNSGMRLKLNNRYSFP